MRYRLWTTSVAVSGLLFLLISAGCSENPPDQVAAAPEPPKKIVRVEIEAVQAEDLVETFTLPADLEAWEDLILSAEIAGTVDKLRVSEGDHVAAASELLSVDTRSLRSDLQRDKENYNVAERKLERYKKLVKEQLVSQQELDELENAFVASESALRSTRVRLAKSQTIAPVSGIVDRLYVDRGEFVDIGKPTLRLVQVDRLKVLTEVPEKDVPFLQIGQTVEIIPAVINQQPAEPVIGQIKHIAYTAVESTRTYRTKIVIDNSNGRLRPGMIVRARFVRQELSQVVSAPLYSVLDRDGEKVVFVAERGRARQVSVNTGASIGRRIVINSGLEAGQSLVVKGQQLLVDGAAISSGGK